LRWDNHQEGTGADAFETGNAAFETATYAVETNGAVETNEGNSAAGHSAVVV
jgi:hypothetical protein